MNNLPKDFKSGFDYSLFISGNDWKLIETEKSEKRSEFAPQSVGSFRKEIKKLKAMRKELEKIKGKDIDIYGIEAEKRTNNIDLIKAVTNEPIEYTKTIVKVSDNLINYHPLISTDVLTISIETSKFNKPSTLTLTPSNPLIDQTVKIIKPTEWIDCISRESKRVFVNDNWIVARILLTPVLKDSIGLKRLTLE